MVKQSIVNTHSEDITSIVKDEYTAIVVKKNNVVMVTSLKLNECGDPHCAYVKSYGDDENSATEKYRHIIAKLITKDSDSKYFKNPIASEHFSNGDTTGVTYEFVRDTLKEAIDILKADMSGIRLQLGITASLF